MFMIGGELEGGGILRDWFTSAPGTSAPNALKASESVLLSNAELPTDIARAGRGGILTAVSLIEESMASYLASRRAPTN
jgi:hypothetical protein